MRSLVRKLPFRGALSAFRVLMMAGERPRCSQEAKVGLSHRTVQQREPGLRASNLHAETGSGLWQVRDTVDNPFPPAWDPEPEP